MPVVGPSDGDFRCLSHARPYQTASPHERPRRREKVNGFPFSIIENRDDYYRLLQEVTSEQRWEEWILFMLRAVAKTAKWTTEKIHAIRDLLDDTCGYVANMNSRVYSRELVELIFIQPYCRIPHLMEAGIAKRPTASKYLNALSAIGVLNEYKLGRNKFLFTQNSLIS